MYEEKKRTEWLLDLPDLLRFHRTFSVACPHALTSQNLIHDLQKFEFFISHFKGHWIFVLIRSPTNHSPHFSGEQDDKDPGRRCRRDAGRRDDQVKRERKIQRERGRVGERAREREGGIDEFRNP